MIDPMRKVWLMVAEASQACHRQQAFHYRIRAMRNILLDPYEDIPRSIVATANDHASGSTFAMHTHRRGQFAYASRGSISVTTSHERWLVPPGRACWIPSGVAHEMTMTGVVTMLNIFVAQDDADAAGMPGHCEIYEVSMLLRQLIEAAIDVPALYEVDSRAGKIMSLLIAEMASMPTLPLRVPLPMDARLAQICHRLFAEPSIAVIIDQVVGEIGMSRRAFTRRFREDTGLSFAAWRQQACLLAAIARLAEGQSVTRIAFDLGYSSASAFTAAFRHAHGVPPGQYLIAESRA